METLQRPNETYFLMTLEQLQLQYDPIGFDVQAFLNTLVNINASNPIKLTANDSLIVLSLELMSQVSTILNRYLLTPGKSHIIIDHLLFSLIFDLSSHLPSEFQRVALPLAKELDGTDALLERWEFCVRETDGAFGDGLGKSRHTSFSTHEHVDHLQELCSSKRPLAKRIVRTPRESSRTFVRCSTEV